MADLIAYQYELLENLKSAEKNFKKSPKERLKKPYLEARLELLEELWKNFKDGHKSIILRQDENQKDPYFKEKIYDTFQELYIQYKVAIKEALEPFIDDQVKVQQPTIVKVNKGHQTIMKLNYQKLKYPLLVANMRSGKHFLIFFRP